MEDKTQTLRHRLTAAVFILLLGGLTLANLLYTPPEISQSERRRLRTRPDLTVSAVLDGQYMTDFEKYAPDSFVLRDGFRTVKAFISRYVLQKLDNSGIVIQNDSAAKLETLDEDAAKRAADRLSRLASRMPEHARLYYAVIPDKSYYMDAFPKADYDHLAQILNVSVGDMTTIDLKPALTESDYYRTDLHWDQSRLTERFLPYLCQSLGITPPSGLRAEVLGDFQGAYAGQAALPLPQDSLSILRGQGIDNLVTRYLDPNTGAMVDGPVYDTDKLASIDPYDVFLRGAQGLVVLDNPDVDTDRELVLFRDSFGSSLAPLLAASYRRVTVVDMRYFVDTALEAYVQPGENVDVLFLYGLQSLNNSDIWRITARR